MQITSKGQVTIPIHIRNAAGLQPYTEVQFTIENGKVFIQPQSDQRPFKKLDGYAEGKFTTQEVMDLMRS